MTEALAGRRHHCGKVGSVIGTGGLKRQAAQKVSHYVVVEVVDELVEPGPHFVAELVVGAGGMTARSDDRVLARQPVCRGEVVQAGKKLAFGEVAGGPEQHEHVRCRFGVLVGGHAISRG